MYKGELKEELYIEMAAIFKSLPDELKGDPIVTAFKLLANMTLDYIAPRTGDASSGKQPPRNFKALTQYIDNINKVAVQASTNANDARNTINALTLIFERVKHQNDLLLDEIEILKNEINNLRTSTNTNTNTVKTSNATTIDKNIEECAEPMSKILTPIEIIDEDNPPLTNDGEPINDGIALIIKTAKKVRGGKK